MRDRNHDYQVLLTDQTSIKTREGSWRSGKPLPADSLRGLIVESKAEGTLRGNWWQVRFKESDLRAAVTTDTRVLPLEENQKRIAGQIDELHSIAAEARSEVRVRTNASQPWTTMTYKNQLLSTSV